MCVVGRVLSAQNKKCISLQYLQKNMGDEVEFLPQINTNIFYKLIVSFWVCRARHAQSTLNNKFPISKDKHNSFPQIDNMILMGMIILMGILKVLKVTSLQYLYNIPKKKSGREFMFLVNIKVSGKFTLSFSMKVIRHVQSTQNKNNIFFRIFY